MSFPELSTQNSNLQCKSMHRHIHCGIKFCNGIHKRSHLAHAHRLGLLFASHCNNSTAYNHWLGLLCHQDSVGCIYDSVITSHNYPRPRIRSLSSFKTITTYDGNPNWKLYWEVPSSIKYRYRTESHLVESECFLRHRLGIRITSRVSISDVTGLDDSSNGYTPAAAYTVEDWESQIIWMTGGLKVTR